MLPLQTELRVVGDAAGTAVCEVSHGAFFAPRALPRLGLLGWVATIHGLEGALAEVRVRESGEGRVGQLKGAA